MSGRDNAPLIILTGFISCKEPNYTCTIVINVIMMIVFLCLFSGWHCNVTQVYILFLKCSRRNPRNLTFNRGARGKPSALGPQWGFADKIHPIAKSALCLPRVSVVSLIGAEDTSDELTLYLAVTLSQSSFISIDIFVLSSQTLLSSI